MNYPLFLNFREESRGMGKKERGIFVRPKIFRKVNLMARTKKKNESLLVFNYI